MARAGARVGVGCSSHGLLLLAFKMLPGGGVECVRPLGITGVLNGRGSARGHQREALRATAADPCPVLGVCDCAGISMMRRHEAS